MPTKHRKDEGEALEEPSKGEPKGVATSENLVRYIIKLSLATVLEAVKYWFRSR